jgi:hypothetical protein
MGREAMPMSHFPAAMSVNAVAEPWAWISIDFGRVSPGRVATTLYSSACAPALC